MVDSADTAVFSYKMTHDTGFAPNPWWGSLTLATCKPRLRLARQPGDWIAGFTSGKLCGHAVGAERLVYLMQVHEAIPLGQYYTDPRFELKRPRFGGVDHRRRFGDNIYRPRKVGSRDSDDLEQVRNPFHGPDERESDVSGRNVLIARRFVYFGREAVAIPDVNRPSVPIGQAPYGAKTHEATRAQRFLAYVESLSGLDAAVVGMPSQWRE